MARLNMVEAINLALREEMERDNRIVVLGEDVGKEGCLPCHRWTSGEIWEGSSRRYPLSRDRDRWYGLWYGRLWTSADCRDSI